MLEVHLNVLHLWKVSQSPRSLANGAKQEQENQNLIWQMKLMPQMPTSEYIKSCPELQSLGPKNIELTVSNLYQLLSEFGDKFMWHMRSSNLLFLQYPPHKY